MIADDRKPDGPADEPDEVFIGLVADPDLPAILADDLRRALPKELEERGATDRTWHVDVVQDPFESMYPDYRDLVDKARQHVHGTRWDLAICITDLPTRRGVDVVAATIDEQERVAVVSLPALGGWRLRHRLRAFVLRIVANLAVRADEMSADTDQASWSAMGYVVRAPGSSTSDIVRQGRLATARLVAGMVRANRPWQMVLGLSTALASAMTGVAFGVLYSTIWALATSLSAVRLITITTGAIIAMAVWIIAGHHLWDSDPHVHDARPPEVRLRNISMVTTVVVGTTTFFGMLFAIALVTVAVVVPPSYLAEETGSATPRDYLTIAMMATVLGTVAGAVGSGLENDTAVRRAAYSFREHERWQRAHRRADDGRTSIGRFRRD